MSDNAKHLNNQSNKARRDTKFKLSFPTMPSLLREPRKIELHQAQYQQDVMVVTFVITGQLWFDTIPTGLPVKFTWSQAMVEKEWYGYVSSISKTVANSQREKTMEVHIVGSSFPLKNRDARVFIDKTIPEIAEMIARENGFAFVGDKDSRRFPQLTMAGHSYWEWLQEQAKRIGFVLLVDGTTLYFRKLDSFINQNITEVPVLYAGETQSQYRGQYYDRTLDMFRVVKGDYIESGDTLRTEKNSGGIDPLTQIAYVVSSTPKESGEALRANINDVLFSEYRTDQVSSGFSDSQSVADGAAQMARLNMPAKVKCQGDPRIRPYGTVHVLGTGELTDGYWVVKEVVHIFQKFGDYNIEMTVVTDGTGSNTGSAFRIQQDNNMSKINIPEIVAQSKILENSVNNARTNLSQISPAILPTEQGFKQTGSRWISSGGTRR